MRALLVTATLLAGCFNQPKPNCAFLCGEAGECPDGYSCATDGWCKLDGVSPEPTCDELPADASPLPDVAPTPDAAADAGPDASGLLAQGAPCSGAGECESGFCSNNRCCDMACGGSCDVCRMSLGASADGTCTNLSGTTVCRAATGPCDLAENCTGSSGACPSDAVQDTDHMCGTAGSGGCDIDDTCDGTSKTCPNEVRGQGHLGSPDCGNYVCDGVNPDCPLTCDGNEDCEAPNTCSAPICT